MIDLTNLIPVHVRPRPCCSSSHRATARAWDKGDWADELEYVVAIYRQQGKARLIKCYFRRQVV